MLNEIPKLTRATVVYMIDSESRICLAQMKKAIHKDKATSEKERENKSDSGNVEQEQIEYSLGVWNGYGGKEIDTDESILHTAIRELEEESGVRAEMEDLEECGTVNFYLKVKGDTPFMQVHFYILRKWQGDPIEGSEMGPATFFGQENIPYNQMMPADKALLERALAGKNIDSDVILMGKGEVPMVEWTS